jgi:putative ABC transport system substrate-binding protein
MNRREFISLLGGAVAWPLAARAQQGERMRRIGVLMSLAAGDPGGQARLVAFVQGLQEQGWTVGHNARIDIRSSVAAAGIVTPLTMRGRVLSWPCHSLSQPNS